jgi:hypothetical protein
MTRAFMVVPSPGWSGDPLRVVVMASPRRARAATEKEIKR